MRTSEASCARHGFSRCEPNGRCSRLLPVDAIRERAKSFVPSIYEIEGFCRGKGQD